MHKSKSAPVGYANNYNWTGIKFPIAINEIDKFEKNNDISVYVLGVKGRDIYIQRKSSSYYQQLMVKKDIIQQSRV